MNLDFKTTTSVFVATTLAAILVLGFNIDIFGLFISPPEQAQQPASTTAAEMVTATVSQVIDGDTVSIGNSPNSENVRLIGVDAPEIDWQVSGEPEAECFGWKAREFLTEEVEGRKVKLAGDARQPNYDDYDRRLAYVYVDGQLVNEALLEGGYARELTVSDGYEKRDAFKQAETAAREAGRGLWSACE